MFNGGSRKRFINGGTAKDGYAQAKRPKAAPTASEVVTQRRMAVLGAAASYRFPVCPLPNKMIPMKPTAQGTHPAFSVQFPYGHANGAAADMNAMRGPPVSLWTNTRETMYPPYEMLWAKHLGLPTAARREYHHIASPADVRAGNTFGSPMGHPPLERPRRSPSPEEFPMTSSASSSHFSAFRPVSTCSVGGPPGDSAGDCRACSDDEDDSDAELTVDVDTIDNERGEEEDSEENNNMKLTGQGSADHVVGDAHTAEFKCEQSLGAGEGRAGEVAVRRREDDVTERHREDDVTERHRQDDVTISHRQDDVTERSLRHRGEETAQLDRQVTDSKSNLQQREEMSAARENRPPLCMQLSGQQQEQEKEQRALQQVGQDSERQRHRYERQTEEDDPMRRESDKPLRRSSYGVSSPTAPHGVNNDDYDPRELNEQQVSPLYSLQKCYSRTRLINYCFRKKKIPTSY